MKNQKIKFNLFVKNDLTQWSEEYSRAFDFKDEEHAKELVNDNAKSIIDSFNSHLRHGESKREFVSSEIIFFLEIPMYKYIECPYCFEDTQVNTSNDAAVCDECLEVFHYEVLEDGTIETEIL